MKEPAEKKTRNLKHPTNIIFNLLALAVLMTVIIFLHQILKKPKESADKTKQEVKSVAALPAKLEAPTAAPAPQPVQITLPSPAVVIAPPENVVKSEPVAETKKSEPETTEAEAKPVVQKPETRREQITRTSVRAEEEISPTELDGEQAREKYMEDNRRLSSGKVKMAKSKTPAQQATSEPARSELDREAAKRFEPRSTYDLDDEGARQKYLDENKRLSRAVTTGEKQKKQAPATTSSSGNDEYIPFEDR